MRVHARLSFFVTNNSPSPVTLIRCFIGRSKPLGRLEEFGQAVFHKEVKIQRSPGTPSISLGNYAGIPGTGPADTVCSGCTFLEADGSRFLCAKYRTMTRRKGQHIRS